MLILKIIRKVISLFKLLKRKSGFQPISNDDLVLMAEGIVVEELICQCGNDEFALGPRGGLSRNIECSECGKRYNIFRVANGFYVDKVW